MNAYWLLSGVSNLTLIMASKQKITFYQQNLRRSANALHEFLHSFYHSPAQIALISEPYTGNRRKLASVSGMQCFQSASPDGTVKACIFIKDAVCGAYQENEVSTNNMVVVTIPTSRGKVDLVSIYVEPRKDVSLTLNAFDEYCQSSMRPKIVGGDFNGHHPEWSLNHTQMNNRGEDLVTLFHIHNLEICNKGNEPTYSVIRQAEFTSVVDLTLVTGHLADATVSWTVNTEQCLASDHRLIEFQMDFSVGTKSLRQSTRLYKTKDADWTAFKLLLQDIAVEHRLEETIVAANVKDDVERAAERVGSAVALVCDHTLERTKVTRRVVAPWWSEGLERMKKCTIKHRHQVQNLKREGASEETVTLAYEKLQQAKKAYSKLMRSQSTKNFRGFCQRQDKESVWDITNRIIRPKTGRFVFGTMHKEGRFTGTPVNTLQKLLEHFYPAESPNTLFHHNQVQALIKQPYKEAHVELPFTMTELHNAIKTTAPQKAPGYDHLTGEIWAQVINCIGPTILALFNKCLQIGYFPTIWKRAVVCPIPKPGKDDLTDITSYRPIGLLPVIGKIFEKLFIQRLTHHMNIRAPLSDHQFGFREQKSTSSALNKILQKVRQTKKNGEHVIAISLDIKAAFDNVSWPHIMYRLRKTACPVNLYRLLENYLSNWTAMITEQEITVTRPMEKGCVQGSVSGPVLWNLVIDELLKMDFGPRCHIQAFADDVILVVSGPTADYIQEQANSTLEQIIKWSHRAKLAFNPDKTSFVAFTKQARRVRLRFENIDIEPSTEIKILGVIVDSGLTFQSHVRYATAKASKLFRKLCYFTRPTWGVHPENVQILYRQVLIPILTYGCEVWGSAAKKLTIRRQLQSIQRAVAIRVIGAFRTVSATAAIALAGVPPLHLIVDAKYQAAQIMETRNANSIEGLDLDVVNIELPCQPQVRLHPALRETPKIHSAITTEQVEELRCEVNLFTDGSKLEGGGVGAGLYYLHDGNPYEESYTLLPHCCTVIQAELYAILRATQKIQDILRINQINSAAIFSDSASAWALIRQFNTKNHLAAQIQTILYELRLKINVRLVWIKAHAELDGNETADKLAKSAAQRSIKLRRGEKYDYNLIPKTWFKLVTRRNTLSKWQADYQRSLTGQHTYKLSPDVTSATRLISLGSDRFYWTQYLTGHSYAREYLHRFKIVENCGCFCGAPIQSLQHLMSECEAFSYTRDRFIRANDLDEVPSGPLHDLAKQELKHFVKYVKTILSRTKSNNELE